MRPGPNNVMQITRPMNRIRRARDQQGCVTKITAPIDSFLYMRRPVEGNGLLATQEVGMEKNFGGREINTLSEAERLTELLGDAELEVVSGGRGFVPPGKRFAGEKDDDEMLSELQIQR